MAVNHLRYAPNRLEATHIYIMKKVGGEGDGVCMM